MGLTALALEGPAAAHLTTPVANAQPAWLFVQGFGTATLTPDIAAPGEYVLTLTDADAAVLAFTDRPDRQVAVVPTADLIAALAAESSDPPNATLVAPLVDGEPGMVVVELWAAAYDAATGAVTYRVTVLAETEGTVQAAATPQAMPTSEQRFFAGHLFVDALSLACVLIPDLCA
jgi:hypothetical protein